MASFQVFQVTEDQWTSEKFRGILGCVNLCKRFRKISEVWENGTEMKLGEVYSLFPLRDREI